MRALMAVAVVLALVVPISWAATEPAAPKTDGSAWLTSFDEAKTQAQKSGKPVLIDFTGSDWCGWCVKLKKEVFDTPEFKDWAAKNVVLLELDFPRKKAQDAQTKQKNEEALKLYKVKGFPTIVFTDAQGKELGRTGYQAGGPKVWTAEADQIIGSTRPAPKK